MPNLALFDFDGTITSADMFTPFIRYAVSRRRMAVGQLVLAPVIASYKLGLVHATVARASVAHIAFAGKNADAIRAKGAAYARERFAGVMRPESLARIAWHQAQGDTVVVVSASLEFYLADWCTESGLDLICTRLEVRNGTLTGRYLHGDCTGPEKARRVRERYDLKAYEVIYAYGDSSEDEELLALAHSRHFRGQRIASETRAMRRDPSLRSG